MKKLLALVLGLVITVFGVKIVANEIYERNMTEKINNALVEFVDENYGEEYDVKNVRILKDFTEVLIDVVDEHGQRVYENLLIEIETK